MQDLNNKVTGGSLTADEWNEVPSELQNPIVASGQSLSSGDLNQLGKAIAAYAGGGDYYTDNGSANVITLLVIGTFQSPPAYRDGLRARFIAGNSNSGAVTIQWPGLGVIALRDQNDVALVTGDIVAGVEYEATYRVSTGRAIIQKPSALTNELPRNFIDGFTLSNNALDATNDLDIAAGACKNSANDVDFELSSALGKRIDAAWAEGGTPGATAGGFPSGLSGGVPVNGTWYRVFAIWRPTGQIDAGFDTSSNAANLLADATNYTKYRQVGWIYYTSSAIKKFQQSGERFLWVTMTRDGNNINSSAGAALTVTAPAGTLGIFNCRQDFLVNNNNIYFLLSSLDADNVTPSASIFHSRGFNASNVWANSDLGRAEVLVNSSNQIRHRAIQDGAGTPTAHVWTLGWTDSRGRQ